MIEYISNPNYKISFKYLKDKFNLKKFIKNLDKEIKLGSSKVSKRPHYDKFRWQSTQGILLCTYDDMIFYKNLPDAKVGYELGKRHISHDVMGEVYQNEKLSMKLFLLERVGKLLPSINKNFALVDKVSINLKSEINLLFCLSSKINKTFYLFINNEPHKIGATIEFCFFKTKKKDKALKVMNKISNMINKNKSFSEKKLNNIICS